MTTNVSLNGRINGIQISPSKNMTDVLELKLPLKSQYLQMARAAAGVIAGGMSFNYDEVVQVRIAVAEAFELTRLRTLSFNPEADAVEVLIRFTVAPNRLEILMPYLMPSGEARVAHANSTEELESAAFLESLMDTVELQGEAAGHPVIRLVKYRAAAET